MTEERCKAKSRCFSGIHNSCEGCNVWNVFHNFEALQEWCDKHNENSTEMAERLKKNYCYGEGEDK